MGLNRHDFGNRNMMRSDFRRGKEEDFRRMMELEGLKQSGATKRTNLTNEADYRRQGLMNAGALEKTKLSNTGSLYVAKTKAGESGRQFDRSHSLNRKRNLFDMANEDRKFALNREKETFDQFDAIHDMGTDTLGGKSTSSFGDRMNSWNTFRKNSGGLTKETIDFAIAKKLSDAKVKGIPVKNINFTDAERESFFSDTKGVGSGFNRMRLKVSHDNTTPSVLQNNNVTLKQLRAPVRNRSAHFKTQLKKANHNNWFNQKPVQRRRDKLKERTPIQYPSNY